MPEEFDWQAWWIGLQVVETADPRECHEWISRRAVEQVRANWAEEFSMKLLEPASA